MSDEVQVAITAILAVIIGVGLGILFVLLIWNSLFTDLFSVRPITFWEAFLLQVFVRSFYNVSVKAKS